MPRGCCGFLTVEIICHSSLRRGATGVRHRVEAEAQTVSKVREVKEGGKKDFSVLWHLSPSPLLGLLLKDAQCQVVSTLRKQGKP